MEVVGSSQFWLQYSVVAHLFLVSYLVQKRRMNQKSVVAEEGEYRRTAELHHSIPENLFQPRHLVAVPKADCCATAADLEVERLARHFGTVSCQPCGVQKLEAVACIQARRSHLT